jgi:hypothetical protein
MDDEKELYKVLVEYVGSSTVYLELNQKLRESNNKTFKKLLTPYMELANLNRKLGFNEHTTVYRGIQFRSEPYEKWWYDFKELDETRMSFPYNKDILKIKKHFITEGNKIQIDQLLATTLDIKIALQRANAEYFKFRQNPVIGKKMLRFVFEIPILKKFNQINTYKLYTYFKKNYDIDKLDITKENIEQFLLQMDKKKPSYESEIVIVPDISTNALIQMVDSGFPTRFKEIQKQINHDYKLVTPVENEDDIVTKDTFFIKMNIQL